MKNKTQIYIVKLTANKQQTRIKQKQNIIYIKCRLSIINVLYTGVCMYLCMLYDVCCATNATMQIGKKKQNKIFKKRLRMVISIWNHALYLSFQSSYEPIKVCLKRNNAKLHETIIQSTEKVFSWSKTVVVFAC